MSRQLGKPRGKRETFFTPLDRHKDAMIRQHVQDLLLKEPNLSHAQAYARITKQFPDLFDDTQPERTQNFNSGPAALNQAGARPETIDLISLCQKMRIPIRIEASAEGMEVLCMTDHHGALLEEFLESVGYQLEEVYE